MNAFSFIQRHDEGDCLSMVLNRPPLNVMNTKMMQEMNTAFEQLLRHPQGKVLLMMAEGRAFSAGVDVADHTADRLGAMMNEFHRMFELIHQFTIPVIAVVDGAALGGGCELALFCDMIIASERATFGQPEIKVGVFPPVAAVVLPGRIGRNRTLEWLMNGETISAGEAERIGLVNRVFPAEGFKDHTMKFVAKFTSHSRVILGMTKRAVDSTLGRPVMEGLTVAEELYLREMMKTEDAHEGLSAFLEKRRPAWKNR